MTDAAPDLDRSRTLSPRVEWRRTSASTNAELVAAVVAEPDAWPDLSVLVTDAQTAGRGRLDRVWTTPPGSSLAISVLLRPGLAVTSLGWIPLIAGLAMTRAVRSLMEESGMDPEEVGLKWPNDVQVRGLKICGVLSQLVATDISVVVGSGLNTDMTRDQLPTDTATSLAIECRRTFLPDDVLSRYLDELSGLMRRFVDAGGDATAGGIRSEVSAVCSTIGSRVRVELPGEVFLEGTAVGLDADGRIEIDGDDGETRSLSAGDVTHLRPDASPHG